MKKVFFLVLVGLLFFCFSNRVVKAETTSVDYSSYTQKAPSEFFSFFD